MVSSKAATAPPNNDAAPVPAAFDSLGRPKVATYLTVFLDRDGVLNKAPRVVLRKWAKWQWLPGARDALVKLNQPGIQVCLATNQPFTTTGVLTPRKLARLHADLMEDVRSAGGRIDRIEAATVAFSRRHKPRPGLLIDGAKALNAPASRCVMVGDNVKDAQAAKGFGCRVLLLATTHTREALQARLEAAGLGHVPIVADLAEAVERILAGDVAKA